MTKRFLNIGLILVAVSLFLLALEMQTQVHSGLMEIRFMDIGQGDASLIKTPSGKNILVDGGPKDVSSFIDRYISPFDKVIDVLVISHPHSDHIEGLLNVFDEYEVKSVLISQVEYSSGVYDELLKKMGNESRLVIPARAGRRLNFGDGAVLEVVYPLTDRFGKEGSNLNNESLAFVMSYGDFKIFMGGDIESSAEKRLTEALGDFIRSSVIKVSHHGSKTSSGDSFLNFTDPLYAVISVGENKFGHPSGIVLDRLEKRGIKYYRTDIDGTVSILTNGKTMSF